MRLKKPIKSLKIAILVPCYKRPEYTQKCIQSINESEDVGDTVYFLINDGSDDDTSKILQDCEKKFIFVNNEESKGLRNVIIDFFEKTRDDFDIIGKIDNDCYVPKDYLTKIIKVFNESPVDILSPNVLPSNAAFTHGSDDECDYGYRPSKIVGGLWFMKTELIKDMMFEVLDTSGFTGAFPLLKQILAINSPVVGWVPDVEVQDVGHWSGKHDDHIKDITHRQYYVEVDRKMGW